MIAKSRQATRRQSRLSWCSEVIAVSAVVTDTAVDIGRTKASIGMAISTAPNPAALRTANAPIITRIKKTRPRRDKDDTLRIFLPFGPVCGQCSIPEWRAATKFSRNCRAGLELGNSDVQRLWEHYRSSRFLDREDSFVRTYSEHT